MDPIILLGALLMVAGIIGSIVPAMPGPIFSFGGILLLYFAKGAASVSLWTVVIFGVTMVLLALMDYVAPILGAKYVGSSKAGLWGALIGAIIGLFFLPPLGIFIGALMGAVIGELSAGKKGAEAMKSGIGVVLGGVVVIFLEVFYSLVAAGYYLWKAF